MSPGHVTLSNLSHDGKRLKCDKACARKLTAVLGLQDAVISPTEPSIVNPRYSDALLDIARWGGGGRGVMNVPSIILLS